MHLGHLMLEADAQTTLATFRLPLGRDSDGHCGRDLASVDHLHLLPVVALNLGTTSLAGAADRFAIRWQREFKSAFEMSAPRPGLLQTALYIFRASTV